MNETTEANRDWPESKLPHYSGSNDNYLNTCLRCKNEFAGNKHRRICFACDKLFDATPAIEVAEHTIATQSRDSERRHTRFKAKLYRRERDLAPALGFYADRAGISDGHGPTRRIIHALGHRLHFQLTSGHPLARRRAPMTRIALFGEILLLKRQLEQEERDQVLFDTCHCGEPMDDHSAYSNHTPRPMGDRDDD